MCPLNCLLRLVIVIGCAIAVAGCSSTPPEAKPEMGNLKALGILYGKYVGAHNGQMPPNEEEFVKYLKSGESSALQQFKVSDVSKLLVSPRDGTPLTVVYGKELVTDPNAFVAYESQAVDGARWVAWTTGQIQELNETQFQSLKPRQGQAVTR